MSPLKPALVNNGCLPYVLQASVDYFWFFVCPLLEYPTRGLHSQGKVRQKALVVAFVVRAARWMKGLFLIGEKGSKGETEGTLYLYFLGILLRDCLRCDAEVVWARRAMCSLMVAVLAGYRIRMGLLDSSGRPAPITASC